MRPITEYPHHESAARRYLFIYGALIFLTFATWAASRLPLGPGHLPVALAIALGKTLLVMLFFMHLADEKGISRLVMLTAVLLLVVLILLVVADVATRFPLAVMREGGVAIPQRAPDIIAP